MLRAIQRIAVPVKTLRVLRLLHVWIGADKPADLGVVVSAAVVVEPSLRIEFLPGKAVRSVDVAFTARHRAPGVVLVELGAVADAVSDDVDAGTWMMVGNRTMESVQR